MLSACGGSQQRRAKRPVTTAPASDPRSRQDVVLSLAGLGTFQGLCPRGAHSWTLRFVLNNDEPTTAVSYRVGEGAARLVTVNPGHVITFHLVPNATKTHEPADRFIPPGQGRGRTAATSVPTTAPLYARIYQATEPQTLRADVHLALWAVGGDSGQCGLVGSTVKAYTYPNG